MDTAQPNREDAEILDVLLAAESALAAPQKHLTELFGVSVRLLRRWLAADAVPMG